MVMINGDETNELLEAQAHVWNYTFNYITSMSLRCAVQLGIPDIVSNHEKPITLFELVKALSIPNEKSTYLYRLMRILVHSGFFSVEKVEDENDGYVLTPSSRLLLKNHKTNLSPLVLMVTDPLFVTSCQFMSTWFLGTDTSSFKIAHGMDPWDYLGQHSDDNQKFNAAMACDTEFVMSVVAKECKAMFEGFGSLVDVGGGTGTMAKAISEAFPHLRCTVYDLPHVVAGMESSEKVNFVGGNMFESVPAAEIILLKWITHDWNDEECVKLLKRCREAILQTNKEGKVIIIDMVLDSNEGTHESVETQLCLDVLVMALATGKERTFTELEKLFLEAGFTRCKITHCLGLIRSIIEVFP